MLTFIRYIEVYFTCSFLDCVRYNEDFVKTSFHCGTKHDFFTYPSPPPSEISPRGIISSLLYYSGRHETVVYHKDRQEETDPEKR